MDTPSVQSCYQLVRRFPYIPSGQQFAGWPLLALPQEFLSDAWSRPDDYLRAMRTHPGLITAIWAETILRKTEGRA
jgi:hypothetical protein